MDGNLRLINDGSEYLLAQFIVNTPFFDIEDIVADGLAQIFQGFYLTITGLASKGVIQFGHFFGFYLV